MWQVRNEEVGWTPVVKKKRGEKKCWMCECYELKVDGGSVMRFRSLNGIRGINIHDRGFRH